jgi:hypothetical protein
MDNMKQRSESGAEAAYGIANLNEHFVDPK